MLNNDDFFYYLPPAGNLAWRHDDDNDQAPGYGVPNGVLNNDDFFFYLAIRRRLLMPR